MSVLGVQISDPWEAHWKRAALDPCPTWRTFSDKSDPSLMRRVILVSLIVDSIIQKVIIYGDNEDNIRMVIVADDAQALQKCCSYLKLSNPDYAKCSCMITQAQELDRAAEFVLRHSVLQPRCNPEFVTHLLREKKWSRLEKEYGMLRTKECKGSAVTSALASPPPLPSLENKAGPLPPPPMPRSAFPPFPPRPTEGKGSPTPTYPERSVDTKYELDSKFGDLKEGGFEYQPHPPPRRPERQAAATPFAPPLAPPTRAAMPAPTASSALVPSAVTPSPRAPRFVLELTFTEQLAIFKKILPSVTPVNQICRLGDTLRGSIIVKRPEHIAPIIEFVAQQFESRGGSYYIKNFWNDPDPLSKGYVGLHKKGRLLINSYLPEHLRRYLLVELQFHLEDIMNGKKGCAKEVAHERLYKSEEAGQAKDSSDLTSGSQLIYLTAMAKLFCTPEELEAAEPYLNVMQAMTKSEKKIRLVMETAFLLRDRVDLGIPQWNEQLQVVVPGNKEAVAREWMRTAEKINQLINLSPNLPTEKTVNLAQFTNTATSVDELYADARQVAPVFRRICQLAASTQPGCYANFGPEDEQGKDCMLKEPKSLQDKIQGDNAKEFGRLMTQFLKKIGRELLQITDGRAVRLDNITAAQTLNFSNCQVTDDDLLILRFFPQLESLSLAGCVHLTDAGLANLAGLTGLRSLNLSGCPITASGLAHLWPLTGLQSVNLLGCDGVSDDDLARVGLQGLNLSSGNRPRSRSPRPLATAVSAQAAPENSDVQQEVDG